MMKQKKTPEVFIFGGLLNFWVGFLNLHSHTYYANINLFNFFTANFTAEMSQIESKQKGDFILEFS